MADVVRNVKSGIELEAALKMKLEKGMKREAKSAARVRYGRPLLTHRTTGAVQNVARDRR